MSVRARGEMATDSAFFFQMDAVTMVCALSLWALISLAIAVERLPTVRTNAWACCLLFVLPGGLYIWGCCYARSGSSAPGRAVVCALPAFGMSLHMRLLLRQAHEWGIPQVSCPGPYVRRWIVSAIVSTSLAVGWARVWCYPEGLVVSLSRVSVRAARARALERLRPPPRYP